MKSLKMMFLGAGLLALCSCAPQGSQKEASTDDAAQDQKNVVIETIMARRSVRKYTDQPVEREKLQQIVECGINAPSGMNKQPWEEIGRAHV